jgi:N-acetylmuramoyl-L-alanine amidase
VEDNMALAITNKLRWYLLRAGVEVILTRPTLSFVPLTVRGGLAKAGRCDMFISVHINAASDPDANGAEVIVTESDARSARLAGKLLDTLVKCGLKRRGVKWDSQSRHSRLKVLRDTYRMMPAALIEVGFITNPADAAKLRDQKWVEQTAAALAQTIVRSANGV